MRFLKLDELILSNNNLLKRIVVLGLLGCVGTGCSYFSFESNLDPSNMKEYFDVANVKSYTDAELMDLNYLELGIVEGVDCRINEAEGTPTISIAKEDARKAAVLKEANGIVYSKCVEFENTPACRKSISCYGRLVYVKED